MPHPAPLPEPLSSEPAFGVRHAVGLGASRRRLEASDLRTPYRGARLRVDAPESVAAFAAAYAARMPATQFFSHSTAAILNGVPLPAAIEDDRLLHVSVLAGDAQPRVAGVIGHQLEAARTHVVRVGGVRMTDAATTWCQLARLLGLEDLVAVGDHLITVRRLDSGRRSAFSSVPALTAAAAAHRRTTGVGLLREALPLLRPGPLSRRESLLRVRVVQAGLPEPVVAYRVVERALNGYEPTVDLAYPEYRVALEYEGDHHRAPLQFRRDIARYERLQDAGWIVVRFTADDVPDRPGAASQRTVARIAARLRSRGWAP
ncbi:MULTISPECIES: endonuclease domain-containing protein [unclassified Agromyces]|uniref:endonuclease domain-containing protein n=1 Tax=unclassified Agromyces TaxID=2639701 RepID=UPI00301581E0